MARCFNRPRLSLPIVSCTHRHPAEQLWVARCSPGTAPSFDALTLLTLRVCALVFSESSELSEQLSTVYESLSHSLSRAGKISFVKIDFDKNDELAKSHGVVKAPSFLIFRDGKVRDRAQGTNPLELRKFAEKIAKEAQALESGSSSAAASGWRGAELPRGYSDITDQVEIRDCEVLNADDGAGTVRTLFDTAKPSGLDKGKDTGSAAKDWVQSGSDDQLLLYIPFQSTVKLHTIQVRESFSRGLGNGADVAIVDFIAFARRRWRGLETTRHSPLHQPSTKHGLC